MIESDTSMEKNSGPRDELTRILDEIDQWIAPIEAETNRAVDFAKTNKRGGHFIALTGAQEASQMPLVANSELFGIFPVDYPPGLVNLTAALAPHCRSEYARLGSATGSVKHELWITGSASKQVAFQMANSIVYLLRITGDWSARAVGYADTSWSAIAGQKSSVIAQVVGEEWHQKERFGSQTVSFADLDWVDHHLVHTLRLRKTENFRLAFDAAGTVHLVADLRMAISQAWAGIEALCNISQELVHRLALSLAVLIHDEPAERLSMYKEVKAVYALRSKAVHGSAMTHEKQLDAVKRSCLILRKALRAIIELDEPIPDADRYVQVLLGGSLIRE